MVFRPLSGSSVLRANDSSVVCVSLISVLRPRLLPGLAANCSGLSTRSALSYPPVLLLFYVLLFLNLANISFIYISMSSQNLPSTQAISSSVVSTGVAVTQVDPNVRYISVALLQLTTSGAVSRTSLINDPAIVSLRRWFSSIELVSARVDVITQSAQSATAGSGQLRFGLVSSRLPTTANFAAVSVIPGLASSSLSNVAQVTATTSALPSFLDVDFARISTAGGHPIAVIAHTGYTALPGATVAVTLANGIVVLGLRCTGTGVGIEYNL